MAVIWSSGLETGGRAGAVAGAGVGAESALAAPSATGVASSQNRNLGG